ncbi:hypothetical protein PAS25_06840 [Leclercia adecarboxylata]|jgi:hypothetical protein|uniref:hypothetical protein n=1 Tax=Leclercia adecarboxylata TaxID=83655 RepID=UPI0013E0A443|nr:hypothetical protein [Leclercia adecarboxylata]UFM68551.1 hypothetical protein LO739_17160 [Leclercia adecarboxylata]UFM70406.1 hypothetical protein LO739_04265 [Leclercia adecarboxylata]URM24015.1 hypothetical protein JJN11_05675 [Leclercia adecarboxylata]
MSDTIAPSTNRSGAAQQVIIELIRAGKITFYDAETTAKEINELYSKLLDGYREKHNS